MSVSEAADLFLIQYGQSAWLVSVGVGKSGSEDAIFVYTSTRRIPDRSVPSKEWMGFPLTFKSMGAIRPAAG